jgi:hypothetical protein
MYRSHAFIATELRISMPSVARILAQRVAPTMGFPGDLLHALHLGGVRRNPAVTHYFPGDVISGVAPAAVD